MPAGREAAALTFTGVAAGYGARTLFEQVSFTANAGSPVGLIGPNGCGKSTLLAVAAGQLPAAAGDIVRSPSSATVGYLAQEPIAGADYQTTVGDYLAAPEQLHQQLEVAAAALADRPDDEAAAARYAKLLQRMTAQPSNNDQAARVRAIFGVDELPPEQLLGQLSGGQKTRIALCRLALDDPAILLLDEPTNHLDLEMLARLERWLQEFRGAVVLASHDRTLLDAVAQHIVAIDPLALGASQYTGGYSDYAATVASARARQEQRYRTEQAQVKRMRRDIARTKEQARSVERSTTPRQPNVRRLAKKVARKATARERKLERFTSDPERATKLARSYRLKIELGAATRSDRALRLAALTAGYPGAAPLLRNLSVDVGGDERICLIGANGAGKTTLLRTLAGALPPVGGEVQPAPSLHLGYLAQEQEPLDQAATALAALRAAAPLSETDARTFLHLFLFTGDDPLRPVGELSLGERTRLGLALLIAGGANCLLLDEPTNHLDIPSRERFEEALAVFAGPVIAVVHDRYFISRFATTVWQIDAGALTVRPGPQRDA